MSLNLMVRTEDHNSFTTQGFRLESVWDEKLKGTTLDLIGEVTPGQGGSWLVALSNEEGDPATYEAYSGFQAVRDRLNWLPCLGRTAKWVETRSHAGSFLTSAKFYRVVEKPSTPPSDIVDDLTRLATWVHNAPHYPGCILFPGTCTCGRDKVLRPFLPGGQGG